MTQFLIIVVNQPSISERPGSQKQLGKLTGRRPKNRKMHFVTDDLSKIMLYSFLFN